MSRIVSRAEAWERTYEAFNNINFAAFDYDTVKRSLIDYVKLYFPESFNDYIETSEQIAIIETFAYMCELFAYRLDVNAHENFIGVAQRKDSVLRLVKLISYTPARPLPARGLVKIQSVQTTESILDAAGVDLASRVVRWNDTSNANWRDQFIRVMNRALEQEYGTVSPTDRFQIQDTVFESYSWNVSSLANGVFSYSATVNGQTVPMELVPVAHTESEGLIERRPSNNTNFAFLYGHDGLGDSSATTGFFCFTKQGSLQRFRTSFDGVTPNQTYTIPVDNVNDTDVWLNNVDPVTGSTLDEPDPTYYRKISSKGKSGEWIPVDTNRGQNVIFNTLLNRNKYEIETRDRNRARLNFGDGEMSDIPRGTFDVWARSSVDQDIIISQSSITGKTASFTYVDGFGRVQTFTFTFTLISTLQNASSAESIEHTRAIAPTVFSAQDRMVNGEDYNSYPRQDSSIMKLRAVNRTYAGQSRLSWNDASGTYSNLKVFSDDGVLFLRRSSNVSTTPVVTTNVLIQSYLQPLLSDDQLYRTILRAGTPPAMYRRTFNTTELERITSQLDDTNMAPITLQFYFNVRLGEWFPIKSSTNTSTLPNWPLEYITYPLIVCEQANIYEKSYNISLNVYVMMLQSSSTNFWHTNQGQRVIDYDTLTSATDTVTILKANANHNRTGILSEAIVLDVTGQEIVTSGTDIGLPDPQTLSVIVGDGDGDGIPDNPSFEEHDNLKGMSELFIPKVEFDSTGISIPTPTGGAVIVTLPVSYICDPSIRQPDEKGNITFETNDIRVSTGPDYAYMLKQNFDWATSTTTTAVDETINTGTRYAATVVTNTEVDVYNAPTLSEGDVVVFSTDGTLPAGVVPRRRYQVFQVVSSFPERRRVRIAEYASTDVVDLGGGSDNFGAGQLYVSTVDGAASSIDTNTQPSAFVTNRVALKANGYNTSLGVGVNAQKFLIKVSEHVYFYRETPQDPWISAPNTVASMAAFVSDVNNFYVPSQVTGSGKRSLTIKEADDNTNPQYELVRKWIRYQGRGELNFAWIHHSPRYHLIDPTPTNVIDMFVITKGYYNGMKRWLEGTSSVRPLPPTPMDLRTSYGYLLDGKMISDAVVMHSGDIKLLFGAKADPTLQLTLKVVRSATRDMTDNQIKATIVAVIRNYFDVTRWEFGETFYYTELATAIHNELSTEIASIVPVPKFPTHQFGDMFQVLARENEVFMPDISVENIEIVAGYTSTNLRMD